MPAQGSSASLDKIAVLQRTELFANLPLALLSEIASHAAVRWLGRGQVLFSEYEEAPGLYIIARGKIRSIRQTRDGREQVLSTEKAGAVLAAVALLDGGKFYSTTIADVPSVVLSIAKQEVQRICRQHSAVLCNLVRVLAQTVRHYAELVEMLALRNVEQRVAQYLLILARQRGMPNGQGCTVELTSTRPEIANQLGTTREAVSRALAQLQRLQMVQLQGRRLVHIPLLKQLEGIAGTAQIEEDVPEVRLSSAWV